VWKIEGTDQFADWFGQLSRSDKVRVEAAIERLEEQGPGLGRPWVDSLVGTRIKELRPRGGFLRILFRFDPRKAGILLMAGDKQGLWDQWYKTAIPESERLSEDYVAELLKEGHLK
jgi:hypothetical protein